MCRRLAATALVMTGALLASLTVVVAAPAVAAPIVAPVVDMDVLLRIQVEARATGA